ncbi:MAG: FecR family protein [Leptospiraceae bacterium]|nr:FecR family protein [Leptospiraceae bacterium]MDW8307625.1 FecR family protein [Leptospiraceae bacterium]
MWQKKYSFSKGEIIFLGCILFAMFISSALLYADFRKKIKVEGKEPIGVLKLKHKTTQRKYDKEVIWEDLDEAVPIYNRDTIRTATESQAVIELLDGTQIEVGENSMIVLNMAGNLANIGFLYGAVRANQEAGSSPLKISTASGEIRLEEGSAVSLSAQEGQNLNVTVNEGKATVSSAGQQIEIGENKRALLGEELEIQEVPFRLLEPAPQERIFADGPLAELVFSWEGPKDKSELVVAKDRNFKEIITRKIASSPQREKLAPGSYYWRIENANNRAKVSESRFLVVVETKKLIAVSPPPNSTVETKEAQALVNFQFSRYDYALSYILRISTKPDLSEIFLEEEILTNFVARKLPPGVYYWQVKAKLPPGAPSVETPISRFSVVQKKELDPPQLSYPPQGHRWHRYWAQKGLSFSWHLDKVYTQYIWELSREKNFATILDTIEVKENSLVYKKDLEEGDYFWRVRARTSEQEEKISVVQKFTITSGDLFVLLSPENKALFQQSQSIEFRWKSEIAASDTLFLLAKDANFQNLIVRERNTETRYFVYNLEPGRYFWKILAFEPTFSTSSEVRSFEIIVPDKDIKLLEPLPNSVVDMSDKDFLRFAWEGSKDRRYILSLVFLDKGKSIPIFTLTLTDLSYDFRELNKLNEGRYRYSVQMEGSTKAQSAIFSIELRKKPEPPEIEIPDIIYIE